MGGPPSLLLLCGLSHPLSLTILSPPLPPLRRVLNDDSPRARQVLRDILYGQNDHLTIDRLNRLANGFGAFTTDGLEPTAPRALAASSSASSSTYSSPISAAAAASFSSSSSSSSAPAALARTAALASTSSSSSSAASSPIGPPGSSGAIDPALRDALVAVLGRRGSYVQQLVVEEAVVAVDALSR